MYCRKCGNELKEDDLFCNKCGNKVINEKEINKTENYKKTEKKNIISLICDNYKIFKMLLLVCIIIMIITFLIVMLGKVNIIWNISRIMFITCVIIGIISLINCQIYSSVRKKSLPIWMNILEVLAIIAIILGGINFIVNRKYEDSIKNENSTLVGLKKNANDKLEEYEKKYGVNYQEHTLESDDILTVVSREKVATYGEFINICEGYGEALVELKNYGYLGMENSFIVYLKVDKSKIDKIYNELASNPKVFKVIKGYLITYDSDSGKNNEGEILDFELKRKDY